MPCSTNTAAAPLPTLPFVARRQKICDTCTHNVRAVCVKMQEQGGEVVKAGLIEVGIAMPDAECPIGKWAKEPTERNCVECTRKFTGSQKLCKWCVEIRAMENRNSNKGLLRKGASQKPPPNSKRKSYKHTRRKVTRGAISSFTYTGGATQFVTLAHFHKDVMALASQVPPHVDTVVGVARSGLNAASVLSMMMNLPMMQLRQTLGDLIESGNGWRLKGSPRHVPAGRHALVVDDTVMTGNSLRAISGVMKASQFDSVTYSAIYVNPLAHRKPDLWVRDLGWPHLLEWNLFNSVLSPNCAVDFDGVLCYDCPPGSDDDGRRYLDFIQNAKPKYLPRKSVVPLVVTARLERYREPTLKWLDEYGVKVQKLVMHPAKTLRERRRDDIGAFKAQHFSDWASHWRPRPKPLMFIESDDAQARRIASLARRLVVCPSSARCYGPVK